MAYIANPYAPNLGDRDPREVIAQTPGRLASLVERLGAAGLERSLAPGKWRAREILCHLADTEFVFAYRLRQALAEDNHVIQPYDQDGWAKPYASLDGHAALAAFSAARQWNLTLLNNVAPADFFKKLSHPERGEMTFQTVVETMGGHDLNHLVQLDKLAEG